MTELFPALPTQTAPTVLYCCRGAGKRIRYIGPQLQCVELNRAAKVG